MAARKKAASASPKWAVIRGSNEPTEEDAKDAASLLRAHYYRSVRSHATSILEEIKSGDIKYREDFYERLQQDANNSYWTIYPYWGRMVLFVSDNWDAYEDEYGEKPESTEAAVAACFLKDLTEQLNAEADGDVEALFGGEDEDEGG